MTDTIDAQIAKLRRKLGLPINHNPSIEQMRAAGIDVRRPYPPPKAPPAKPWPASTSPANSEMEQPQ